MATPPVQVEFTAIGLEDVKRSFAELAATSKETKQSVEQDAKVMAAGFRMLYYQIYITAQTGRLIAELGEQMGFLDKETANAISRTMSLISIFGGLMSTLSSLTRLTQTAAAAEWLHVAALKAKAVAAAIAHGIASLGAAVPLIVAAAVAATAIALAATAQVPSERGTPTMLAAGAYEHVPRRQALTLVFDIHDNRFASDYDADRAGDRIVDRLRRAGVI